MKVDNHSIRDARPDQLQDQPKLGRRRNSVSIQEPDGTLVRARGRAARQLVERWLQYAGTGCAGDAQKTGGMCTAPTKGTSSSSSPLSDREEQMFAAMKGFDKQIDKKLEDLQKPDLSPAEQQKLIAEISSLRDLRQFFMTMMNEERRREQEMKLDIIRRR